MRIFVSYRRADTAGHAGRLCDSLQAHFGRENVFMDLSAIDSGQNFVDAIDTAVRSSDALVAIIGDDWLTCLDGGRRRLDQPTDFVRSEIAAALERGVPVIPVLVEGTTMPSADALPDVLKPLTRRQAHELSDARWSYDVGRLIDAIEKLGGKGHAWDRRKRLSLAAALALIAILGTTFVVRMLREPDAGLQNAGAYAERATQEATSDAKARSAEPQSVTPERVTTGGSRAAGTGPSPTGTPAPSVDLAGEWSADVTYSWGAKYTERFTLKLDGNEVFGTASFLRVRRGIQAGTLSGNSIQFQTQTEEVLGDSTRTVTHRYRGRISGNVITFFMQSDGASSSEPIEFTATRMAEGTSK